MIFYFAGHGSRAEATGNHMSRDLKVETICPVDERTANAAGYVHTIPDYILGWLLKELAEKKGPNIVCTSSAMHTRGLIREELTVRTATTDSARVPPELDSHLWEGKTNTVESYRLWNMSTASHVLLAACRAIEKAKEVDYDGTRRGRFTIELIDRLRWAPHWKTTYRELIDMIPVWNNQTPHCGGRRSTHLVFSGNYPITGLRAFLLKPYPEGTKSKLNPTSSQSFKSSQSFSVAIGSVKGVVPGTEFYAYDEQNNLLCTLVAQSVKVGHTILTGVLDKPEVDIPSGSRVRVSDWKNHPMILNVHTPADFLYTADLFPAATDRPPKFVQAKLREAHILVRSDGDEIVIEPLTATMLKCMTEVRFPLHGNPAHLPDVFDGVAHFNYFLERKNVVDPLHGFALEMHQLRGRYPAREPDPSVGQKGNMVVDGAVRFVSDADAIYGFTIRNTSPEELFPYLFYFDPEEYTIEKWYTPESRNAAPLYANDGTVTVGMGGEKAFEFSLPRDKRESSGFLKLFVTREFIDLGWIVQGLSPFDQKFEGTGRLKVQREKLDCISTWDALTVTLTMVSD
ncbi:hypothetical protein B0H19DRAFT_1118255 [Mycena capillaripes]|nr:hypothetical protein B0H19DRAFT_1118255 [Mycena capillaripes]